MKKFEPKQCVICGKPFMPGRCSDILCGDPACKKARRRQKLAQYQPLYNAERRAQRAEARMIKENRKAKTDNIIAIGYAERQREQTLKMVGKVKVEL